MTARRRVCLGVLLCVSLTGAIGVSSLASGAIPRLSDRRHLVLRATFGGPISPKSVAPSGTGLVLAPNMIYRHTITVYSSKRLRRIKTISDAVRLSGLGIGGYSGVARGAPVEVAFSPDGRYLYATLNAVGRVARLDRRTGHEVTVATGSAPRSLTIAADGRSLYVVNYLSGTVSTLRTRDLKVLQTIDACHHPIGITYDWPTGRIWVACYTGSIRVYDDR